jgi:hypothetical protein
MDFVAHFLWSAIIFSGPQIFLAIFFGILPDFIPFGLNMIVDGIRNKKQQKEGSAHNRRDNMIAYFEQPENQWVYKLYNYTHSIIIWGFGFLIAYFIGRSNGFFPIFIFAWLLHILIDIPTHEKRFFAPQFLTPLSKFCVDGKSWAHPVFMAVNYILIFIFLIWRLIDQNII